MYAYRSGFSYSDEPQPFHLIEKKGWEPSHVPGKPQFYILTWCDLRTVLTSKDKYEPLDKEKHKKKLCDKCIKMFKQMRKK